MQSRGWGNWSARRVTSDHEWSRPFTQVPYKNVLCVHDIKKDWEPPNLIIIPSLCVWILPVSTYTSSGFSYLYPTCESVCPSPPPQHALLPTGTCSGKQPQAAWWYRSWEAHGAGRPAARHHNGVGLDEPPLFSGELGHHWVTTPAREASIHNYTSLG